MPKHIIFIYYLLIINKVRGGKQHIYNQVTNIIQNIP